MKGYFHEANEALAKKEAAITDVTEMKKMLEDMHDYEKTLQDLYVAHNSQNHEGVLDILRSLSFTDLINNKHVPVVGRIYEKYEKLLMAIQNQVFRSINVRDQFEDLDSQVLVLLQISSKNLLPVSVGKFWQLCITQVSSIIQRGETIKRELNLSKEEDLIHRLKSDIYEKFINAHMNVNMEDISKNCAVYLRSVSQAFSGMQVCSKIFKVSESSKKEFATAAKDMVKLLTEEIYSIAEFMDYRLVDHKEMSQALRELVATLKRVHFDENPVEDNKKLKQTLFRLLIEYYKHQLRTMTDESSLNLTLRRHEPMAVHPLRLFRQVWGYFPERAALPRVFQQGRLEHVLLRFHEGIAGRSFTCLGRFSQLYRNDARSASYFSVYQSSGDSAQKSGFLEDSDASSCRKEVERGL